MMKCKKVRLLDVADIEFSAKQGKIYPKGAILAQISASRGQLVYLREESEVGSQYAVILPKADYQGYYLFCIMSQSYRQFFERYKQGLNFVPQDLTKFEFTIHTKKKTRDIIARMFAYYGDSNE